MIRKNKVGILLLITLILILSTVILSRELNNLDEIWNYNLSRNIAEGRIPYKDFNIVQMPGLFIITAFFLKISNELIVTRILGIILSTAIMLATYKLLTNLKIHKYIAAFSVLIITYIFLDYFCLDYNFLNLLIVLILMILENKNINNSSKKFNLMLGIIAGASFLVKQTTGAFIIIALLLFKLMDIKKDNFKQIIKQIFIRVLGVLIPILIFALYLTIDKAWYDFIDYTILGIFTFNNKKSYLELLVSNELHIKALSIIIPAYFAGMTITWFWKRDKTILLFLLYGLASFIVVYPIADNIHFLIGALPSIIGIIYITYRLLNKIKEKYIREKITLYIKYMLQCAFYMVSIIIIVLQLKNFINTVEEISGYNELAHFTYIPVSDRLLEQIQNVDEYILNSDKPIYILDATAALYMIPINKYNKDYDMFLRGNIGSKGEEGQIEKLENMKNTYILIMNDSKRRNWQTPTKVMEYIEENLEKIDTVEVFDVYKTN